MMMTSFRQLLAAYIVCSDIQTLPKFVPVLILSVQEFYGVLCAIELFFTIFLLFVGTGTFDSKNRVDVVKRCFHICGPLSFCTNVP